MASIMMSDRPVMLIIVLSDSVTWVSVLRITGLISSDYTEPFVRTSHTQTLSLANSS